MKRETHAKVLFLSFGSLALGDEGYVAFGVPAEDHLVRCNGVLLGEGDDGWVGANVVSAWKVEIMGEFR